MDTRLKEKGDRLSKHLDELKFAQDSYLTLEAERKPLWSKLFLDAEGKNNAEREAKAFIHPDWKAFIKRHAKVEADYYHNLRLWELYKMSWQSEYGTMKYDTEAIKRGAS